MKKYFYTLIMIVALTPSMLFASSIHSSVDATSDTGGNSVGEGGIVTTGAVNTSASVHTVINGTDTGGTADIEIRTTNNGVENKETRHIDIPAGGSLNITVATSSSAHGSAQATSTAHQSTLLRLIQRLRLPGSTRDTRATSTIRSTTYASSATTFAPPTVPDAFFGFTGALHEISSLFAHIFSSWSI